MIFSIWLSIMRWGTTFFIWILIVQADTFYVSYRRKEFLIFERLFFLSQILISHAKKSYIIVIVFRAINEFIELFYHFGWTFFACLEYLFGHWDWSKRSHSHGNIFLKWMRLVASARLNVFTWYFIKSNTLNGSSDIWLYIFALT